MAARAFWPLDLKNEAQVKISVFSYFITCMTSILEHSVAQPTVFSKFNHPVFSFSFQSIR